MSKANVKEDKYLVDDEDLMRQISGVYNVKADETNYTSLIDKWVEES